MSDEAAHARIGPSSLSRVMICPGSVRENDKLPNTSNSAAAEGSVLHEIAAECLLDPFKQPHDFIGETRFHDGYSFVITEDHADCMMPAIDWLRSQPGEMFVEQRVSLDPWMPGQFGTGDVGHLSPDGTTALIFDWKFGAGVPVHVADNPQLKAYALGFLHTVFRPRAIQPQMFRLIIEQPRNHEGGRYWERWDISLEDLLAFGEELRALYGVVCDPNAPLVASEKGCQFCAVKDTPHGCPAYTDWMFDFLDGALDDLDNEPTFTDPVTITPERRWHIVKHAHLIKKWLSWLDALSVEAAAAGNPDPGSKLVLGRRGNRYYANEDAATLIAYAALGDGAFNYELKSIAQVEKILKPGRKREGNPVALEALNRLVTQDEGKPILVSDTDEREAYTPAAEYLAELDDEIPSFD